MRSACFGADIARCSGSGARGEFVHMALVDAELDEFGVLSLACEGNRFPVGGTVARAGHPTGASHPRPGGARARGPRRPARVARPRQVAAATPARRGGPRYLCAEPLRVSARRRRRPASDSGRPGSRRHHRARSLPLHGERRDDRAPRGAARLRAQGDRIADGAAADRPCRDARRTRFRATARWRTRWPFRGRSRRRSASDVPLRARLAARADGRAGATGQSLRRYRRHLQRCRVRHDARAVRAAARAGAARGGHLFRPPAHDGSHRAGRSALATLPTTGDRRSRPSSSTFARTFPSSSSCTTTPRRCRTAPSAPGSCRRRWRDSSAPEATSAGLRGGASTRDARRAIRRTTSCSSTCRCSRTAT